MQRHDSLLHLSCEKSFPTKGYAWPGHLVNSTKTSHSDDEPHDTKRSGTAIQNMMQTVPTVAMSSEPFEEIDQRR
jgi:hypothetical protein